MKIITLKEFGSKAFYQLVEYIVSEDICVQRAQLRHISKVVNLMNQLTDVDLTKFRTEQEAVLVFECYDYLTEETSLWEEFQATYPPADLERIDSALSCLVLEKLTDIHTEQLGLLHERIATVEALQEATASADDKIKALINENVDKFITMINTRIPEDFSFKDLVSQVPALMKTIDGLKNPELIKSIFGSILSQQNLDQARTDAKTDIVKAKAKADMGKAQKANVIQGLKKVDKL